MDGNRPIKLDKQTKPKTSIQTKPKFSAPKINTTNNIKYAMNSSWNTRTKLVVNEKVIGQKNYSYIIYIYITHN